jgi:hypothetical protein
MSCLSSTPVLWPIWVVLYVLLCASNMLLVLVQQFPRLLTLESGLPALDTDAAMRLGVGICKFNCEMPGIEEVLSRNRIVDGLAGALVFHCISSVVCDWAVRKRVQTPEILHASEGEVN